MMKLLVVLASVCLLPWTVSEPVPHHKYHEQDKQGAVASESAVCSRIGINLIKAGGNAADAVSPASRLAFHPPEKC